jgi:hypothetical protein
MLVESYALSATFAIAYTIANSESSLSSDVFNAALSQVDVRHQLLSREYSAVH